MAPDINPDCFNTPPVVVELGEYKEKGSWKSYGGYDKVYFTGPADTGTVIVNLYDVFGHSPQGIQGADLMVEQANALVIIPDPFRGDVLHHDDFGATDDATVKKREKWWATTGNWQNHIDGIIALCDTLEKDGYQKIGLVGFCWGAKLATLVGRDATKVDAIASVHPAKVEPSDADHLAVPIALYPGNTDPKDLCDQFWEKVQARPIASKSAYKYYTTVRHGFAGGRANLKDEEGLKQYKDVHQRIGVFFRSNLA